jgi:hypothetical protein
MVLAALADETDELPRRVLQARAFFRPHTTVLRLADQRLQRPTSLVQLARSAPPPTRSDPLEPVAISLPD